MGKATGGRLTVRLLRLDLQGRMGLFGRRANTYVKAVCGSESKDSPTVVYDPSGPLQFSRVQCVSETHPSSPVMSTPSYVVSKKTLAAWR